jgi:hypothetical protein
MNPDQFLDNFGTRTGRWLANRLNLKGTGSVKLADLISSYAWNKRAAVTLAGIYEMKGQSKTNAYADYCNILRKDIENHPLYDNVKMRLNFW